MGIIPSVGRSEIGFGLMAAGGGAVALSMAPDTATFHPIASGTPSAALLLGGLGTMALGAGLAALPKLK